MKFRVISDLHVEFYAHPIYLQRKLTTMYPEIDDDEVLIVAGDLGVAGNGISHLSINPEYKSMLEYFAKRWNYVIVIPGNHEYYDRDRLCTLDDVDNMIRKECDRLGIVFLNKNSVILDLNSSSKKEKSLASRSKGFDQTKTLVLLGCTLWSRATPEAYKGMNDKLKAILSYKELIDTHTEHCVWLEKELLRCKKKGQEAIVVTHHLPLQDLTHPKYLQERYRPLNSAYASNLDDFIIQFRNLVENPSSKVEGSGSGVKTPEIKIISKELSNPEYIPKETGPRSIEELIGSEKSEDESYDSMIKKWFCGHTHEKTEKTLYGVPFLINPLGYPRESKMTKTKTEIIEL